MQRSAFFLLIVALIIAPLADAHAGHTLLEDDDDKDSLLMRMVATQKMATLEEVRQVIADEGYPYSAHPEERFDNWTVREDITEAGDLEGAVRIMRFVQVTDMQLVDDDAVSLRCSYREVDEGFGSLGLGLDGCWRPQEEYGDEILHSVVDVLNEHHDLDSFDFAIHTGDNIDNALENELVRYIDIIEGTHTTTGPLSGFDCAPDGQSTSVDDMEHDVADKCTSLPEHLVPEIRGIADDMVWYSVYGNHDGLIQGNLAVTDKERAAANAVGRMFIQEPEYVAMHFNDLENGLCDGGSIEDDFGHGFGLAPEANRCDDNSDNDGYYAFDHQGVRMIVLDTVHDDLSESNDRTAGFDSPAGGASGLAPGGLDVEQFRWLQAEIADNPGPIFLFGHHTVTSFWNGYFDEEQGACYDADCLDDVVTEGGFVGKQQLMALIADNPNIFTFFGGHSHYNKITSQHPGSEHSGFWNVETSGLLDLPQETRIVELWRTADGSKWFWAMDPIGHLFADAQELAKDDSQVDAEAAAGEPGDRQVILWMDAQGSLMDGVQPPLYLPDNITVELIEPETHGDGEVHVEELGVHPVTVTVTGPDGPLKGVTAFFGVSDLEQPADTHEEDLVTVISTFTPMQESEQLGTFTTSYDFAHDGIYTVGINLVDRDGMDLGTEYFDIESGEGLGEEEQGAPVAAVPFLLAGIVLALMGARRD